MIIKSYDYPASKELKQEAAKEHLDGLIDSWLGDIVTKVLLSTEAEYLVFSRMDALELIDEIWHREYKRKEKGV